MKKIVIVPDSFKGSASSIDVADSIEKGIIRALEYKKNILNNLEIKKIPIADGGEGTVDSVLYGAGGDVINIKAHEPMGQIIDTFYGMIDSERAVIEMAAAAGLPLVPSEKRNPLLANTFGVGELIVHAISKGAKDILIGIGGSATNDFGIGMASALGYRFFDEKAVELSPLPKNMIKIKKIDSSAVDKRVFSVKISVACDVSNPLYGEKGATAVYGKQKGVTEDMFDILDNGLKNLSEIIKRDLGKDVANISGAGAAGGLGAGLIAFAGGNLKSGIDAVLDIVGFDEYIKDASLVVTGEGAIDGQTKHGKVPLGVALRAQKQNVPVIAVVGDIRDGADSVYEKGIVSIMPSVDRAMSLDDAIKNSRSLIEDAAFRAMRFISIEF